MAAETYELSSYTRRLNSLALSSLHPSAIFRFFLSNSLTCSEYINLVNKMLLSVDCGNCGSFPFAYIRCTSHSYMHRTYTQPHEYACVGRGGALVESMPFDQRVAGSNPALFAAYGLWASPLLTVACSPSACKLRHGVNCCGRKRFRKAHALRSAMMMMMISPLS